MKYNYYSKINLYCLLIAMSAIYMQLMLPFILFRLKLIKKGQLSCNIYYIIFVQYLINVISRRRLQVISFILLSESFNPYPTYKKYLHRYKIFFQQFIINNTIENSYHINDQYINIMAIIYLRLVSLSIDVNAKRLLWLYMFCNKLRLN